jgi:cytochrome c biogenesis protein CcmG, thiol:disulfide interchange protein DsbE
VNGMGRRGVFTSRMARVEPLLRFGRFLACAAAAGTLAVGIGACGSGSSGDGGTAKAPDYERALAGAPKPLAQLYDQANQLLPGGTEAFQQELARLHGHPVVVNNWASWCGPCREEFPVFQDVSAKLGKRVAFLGVDSDDSAAAAATFLKELPVPYPSYSDPDKQISALLKITVGLPGTAFYDSEGKLAYVKQGQYSSDADLAADIRRYAK